jgi:uncharacterized tellurite resistance protein B-like protein
MPSTNVIMDLAKVMVAAAWADGVITNEEMTSLKDLLFHLPGMTASDWTEIDIYIESPVDEAERQRLVENLQSSLASRADQVLAIQALEGMISASGGVNPAEQAIVEEIKAAIRDADVGLSGRLSHFIHNSVRRRSHSVQGAPNRELYLDDFVKNRIFFDVNRRLEQENAAADIPEEKLRKLSLAGGLMARVAYVDRKVTDEEYQQILQALQENWGISQAEAALVSEVAVSDIVKGLDYFRLTRQFFDSTTEEERVCFLDVLFAITTSDGQASFDEIEEIRRISSGLLLTHKQFIDAKQKVPRDKRMF